MEFKELETVIVAAVVSSFTALIISSYITIEKVNIIEEIPPKVIVYAIATATIVAFIVWILWEIGKNFIITVFRGRR